MSLTYSIFNDNHLKFEGEKLHILINKIDLVMKEINQQLINDINFPIK